MISSTAPIRAVTFDLDGLMFNTETLYEEVGGELLRRQGKVMTRELLDQMMGRPSRIALQIMIDWHRLETTIERLQLDTDEIFEQLLEERLAPMPGLLELLQSLEEAGIPKAIGTSSRRKFVDRVLTQMDMAGRFAFILSAEDVTHGKPAPEIYLSAARRFRVRPDQMMVLEDSQIGCRAAVAAGAFAVAVPGAHSRLHNFDGAALVVNSLADRQIYRAIGLGNGQP
jgi:HAD superfamily hydrolase (TIGR01509 family)